MKHAWRMRLVGIAVGALIWLHGANQVSACPNCKEAVSAQPAQVASMANGYNWSVLFMLAVPFSMMGTGAFMVHRAVKRGLFPEL